MKSSGPVESQWAGLDTETQNGKAVLLGVARPDKATSAEPAGFGEALDWLALQGNRFVAYNMDYDVRALMAWLPRAVWVRLFRYEHTRYRGWVLSYRPGREWTARRVGWERSVRVYDVLQHYQKSLDAAARETLGEGKHAVPRSWMKKMSAVLADRRTRDKAIRYCEQDARLVLRLWTTLETQYRALGVPEKTLACPVSPGSIAGGFFGPMLPSRTPWEVNAVFQPTYAGGRVEVYRRGAFAGCWAYDLKSAYPWALSRLPDPRNLTLLRDRSERPDAVYSAWRVRVSIPRRERFPYVACWSNENVRVYPVGLFTAWVTGLEFDALLRDGFLRDVLDGWHLCGERKTWGLGVENLFALRAKRPEISYAVKLVLNSIYGKLAEKREQKRDAGTIRAGTRTLRGIGPYETFSRYGKYAHLGVASYVTAAVRLKVTELLRAVGERAVLCATDGIVMQGAWGPALKKSPGLGDWTLKAERADCVVVGTGVYSIREKGGPWQNMRRGWATSGDLPDLLKSFRSKVIVKSRAAHTLADAVRDPRITMNQIEEVGRTLDVNFDVKRAWPRPWRSGRDLLANSMDSDPLILVE